MTNNSISTSSSRVNWVLQSVKIETAKLLFARFLSPVFVSKSTFLKVLSGLPSLSNIVCSGSKLFAKVSADDTRRQRINNIRV